MIRFLFVLIAFINASLAQLPGTAPKEVYYGTPIGRLTTNVHGVSGDVYSVDESTVFIKNFHYDGQGPDAYFWGGNALKPDENGFIIPDEKGSTKPLSAYNGKDVVLRLPEGKTLRDIRYLSVWCRKFKVNFGDLQIPRNLPIPSPVEIPALSQLAHGVKSGPITIVDAQTFLVPNFHYDGEGPAGYWWSTRGQRQGPHGLRLKDENNSPAPLRRYSGETVVISLPDDKTIYDFDFFGVWCEEFNVDFGNVRIPQHVRVPPSPKMLGIKPETKLNCEVLYDDLGFEIRWVMDGDDIVMQLVGKVDPNEYMAFGLSKDDSKSEMVNSDAVVTWVMPNGEGKAVDYFLGSKEQCVGTRGSCPDVKQRGASDSITLLHAAIVNGYSMVTFKRPQLGIDENYDQHVYSDGPQAIMWAVGPLNQRQEVSYHRLHTNGDMFIDFARTPKWNCPSPDTSGQRSSQSVTRPVTRPSGVDNRPPLVPSGLQLSSSASPRAWQIPPIVCPADTTFRAQIGPTGGQKGYQSITGKVGWGIAWYINGMLIPEMVLQRGKTYTFIVEGGNDYNNSARRHPMYLTDSAEGGFDHKTDNERRDERIFGGVGIRSDGVIVPTAEGRLCEWKIDTSNKKKSDDYDNFGDFQKSLSLECQPGTSGILRFAPDKNTPDTVYYQCYTHRNLGWKIRIVDNCDHIAGAASIRQVIVADPKSNVTSKIRQQTYDSRIKPTEVSDRKPENKNTPKHGQTNRKHENVRPQVNSQRPFTRHPSPHRGQMQQMFGQYNPMFVNPGVGNYHGPPPHLFGYQAQQGPNVRFPSGPVSSNDHKYRPPTKKPHQSQVPAPATIAGNLHGGFVPMLINSANKSIGNYVNSKETEQKPDIQSHEQKPQSFSHNSSLSFHNTFKPSSFDFSGFNISRYGELTPYGTRPVQLKKPIVPLPKPSGDSPPQRVNIPVRYKIQGKPLLDPMLPPKDTEPFILPASIISADENSVPSEDVINEYLDGDNNDQINDDDDMLLALKINTKPSEDHMMALERGSQSQESQNMAVVIPHVQAVKDKGQQTKPSSSSTTDLVEVVDESPLKEESEVSPQTTIVTQILTKEELKNKTDHTILTDVLRQIAQKAPIPEVSKHSHVEVHMKVKRETNADNHNDNEHDHHKDHKQRHYKSNSFPIIPNIITFVTIIIMNRYF